MLRGEYNCETSEGDQPWIKRHTIYRICIKGETLREDGRVTMQGNER